MMICCISLQGVWCGIMLTVEEFRVWMGGSGAPINQTEKQRIQKEVTDRGNITETDTKTE